MTLLQRLKSLAPTALKQSLRRQGAKLRHWGLRRQCNACGSRLRQFAVGSSPPVAEFFCPVCRTKPPHRLAAHYFQTHPELFVSDGLCVHVAPETEIRRLLTQQCHKVGMIYRGGGITGVGEEYLDLLALPFADQSVHLVYCCHVLNSLQDDRGAMREVQRVLHPQGTAILQVPAFYTGQTTLETNGEAERIAAFNDVGITRCYTNADYVDRLTQAGFAVNEYWAKDLPADTVNRHQLHGEILHVCRRRGSA